ncbi:YdeI/OmpD-associated family protein [Promicromonospora vindobonensis]|uniref:YdeI/OmpD-associated family protein n=1 Tax=Promicromonospora vindobonensis TaxID=195748 RepID=A0ABW5VTE0_9MICO
MAVVRIDERGRTHVPVPFEPDDAWGAKPRHHVTGTLNGLGLRGVLDRSAHGYVLVLGPAWCRDVRLTTGDRVEAVLVPEGPQRADLPTDIAVALDAAPDAGAFFDSLAQFYRNAYLRWIEATKRRPEQRPVRIAEVVRLLQDGQKERPKS